MQHGLDFEPPTQRDLEGERRGLIQTDTREHPRSLYGCHPSYDPCLPIVDDLDCPDVRDLGKAPVEVIGPDEYRLDRDNDGLGCE